MPLCYAEINEESNICYAETNRAPPYRQDANHCPACKRRVKGLGREMGGKAEGHPDAFRGYPPAGRDRAQSRATDQSDAQHNEGEIVDSNAPAQLIESTEGYGRVELASVLNERGIKTGQGSRWHPQTVKRVLDARPQACRKANDGLAAWNTARKNPPA